MDTQQGRRFRRIIVFSGPMAGTVRPIPPSSVHPYDHLFDDPYVFDDHLFDDDDDDDDDDDYLAHRSSKRPRVAATSEAILSLQEVTRSGEECAVCLQDFRADETLRAMPCSHAFHQHCISEWLRRNAVCPLCRRRLPEEEEEDKQRRRRI